MTSRKEAMHQAVDKSPPLSAGSVTEAFMHQEQTVRCLPVGRDDVEQTDAEGGLTAWLLGTGTPSIVADRAGPATLVEVGQSRVLVDAGNGVGYQLAQLGKRAGDLTHIVITHHHLDHNVDLPFLLLSPWIQRTRTRPPVVIGPRGTQAYVDRVLAAQDYDIRVRIPHGYDPAQLAVPVLEVDGGVELNMGSWRLRTIRVDHDPVDEAFGYRFHTNAGSLVISGDTTPCESLVEAARGAEILIHEVLYPGFGIPEYHTSVHDVGKIAARAEVGELVLTHLIPGDLPDHLWTSVVKRDFQGKVTVGHDLLKVCDFGP